MKIPILDKKVNPIESCKKIVKKGLFLEREVKKQYIFDIDSKSKIAEETLNIIQECIKILGSLKRDGLNIEKAIEKHAFKLIDEDFKFKRTLEMRILEEEDIIE